MQGRNYNVNWGGSVYSKMHFHALPDIFLFKFINWNLISREICEAEHEYTNIHYTTSI